jgi:hypothetical protein
LQQEEALSTVDELSEALSDEDSAMTWQSQLTVLDEAEVRGRPRWPFAQRSA